MLKKKNMSSTKHSVNHLEPWFLFLASQDALEVMLFTDSLTYWVDVSIDWTDVTPVGDDT